MGIFIFYFFGKKNVDFIFLFSGLYVVFVYTSEVFQFLGISYVSVLIFPVSSGIFFFFLLGETAFVSSSFFTHVFLPFIFLYSLLLNAFFCKNQLAH